MILNINVKHTVYFSPFLKNKILWLSSAWYVYSDIGLFCGLYFLASYKPLSGRGLFDLNIITQNQYLELKKKFNCIHLCMWWKLFIIF